DAVHFRLKSDEHVANLALGEGLRCRATARIENRNVSENLTHKLRCLCLVAIKFAKPRAISGKIGIAAIAGGFRVREDDLNAIFREVIPIPDVLRIALTHEESGR